ncbi:hypothetical protein BJ684DRAFT_14552 [Piptocephalis cylindrospora]|uniref:Uncharacterized protein n=1 Tax=Piptocephalis cylindrospora TaxID=1907219 RepID=A0A4V1IYN3_9FUNG|nr:hypothetical protein BJ684DRAFT_14552 [Piptocephalis cylindrospora]|eukprot:RKP15159.1 hypothetical protein BJ684DRAFT_14552 [Piptocephalis cylindrospora]
MLISLGSSHWIFHLILLSSAPSALTSHLVPRDLGEGSMDITNPRIPGNPSYVPPTGATNPSPLPFLPEVRADSVQQPEDREQDRALHDTSATLDNPNSSSDPHPLRNITLGPAMGVNDTNLTLVWTQGDSEADGSSLIKAIPLFANVTFSPALILGKDVRDQPLRLLTGDWVTLEAISSRRYLSRGDAYPLPGDPGAGRLGRASPGSSQPKEGKPGWIRRGWHRILGIFGSKKAPAADREPNPDLRASTTPSPANADRIREAVASQSSGQQGLGDVMGGAASPVSPSFLSSIDSSSVNILSDGTPMVTGHYSSHLKTLQSGNDNRTSLQFEVLDRTHVRIRLDDLSYLSLSPTNSSIVCAGSWGPEGALIFRVVQLADGLIRLHSAQNDLVLTHNFTALPAGPSDPAPASSGGFWSRRAEKKRKRKGLPSTSPSSSESLILSPLLPDSSNSTQQWRVRSLSSRKEGYEERMSGVQYDVEGAQARMTEREVVADLIFPNESKTAQQMSYAFSAALGLTHSTSWITQGTYEQSLTLEWGIPKFGDFSLDIKGNVQAKIALMRSKMATETVQTTRTQSFTFSLTVPPQRQIRAAASALFANADIPFTASVTRVLLAHNDDHLSKQQYAIEGILKEENFAEQRYHIGEDEPVDPGVTRDPSIKAIPISDAPSSSRGTGAMRKPPREVLDDKPSITPPKSKDQDEEEGRTQSMESSDGVVIEPPITNTPSSKTTLGHRHRAST